MTLAQYIRDISQTVRELAKLPQQLRDMDANAVRSDITLREQLDRIERTLASQGEAAAVRHAQVLDNLVTIFDHVEETHGTVNDIFGLLNTFPGEAVVFEFEITYSNGETKTVRSGETMLLPRNSTIHVKAIAYDSADPATRNVAVLDGPAQVKLTNAEGLHELKNLSESGLEFDIVSGAKAGSSLLEISGDAKIGEGVVPVVGSDNVLTPPGEAVVIQLEVGGATPNVPSEPGSGGSEGSGSEGGI